jgi:ABC-type amino acid transport system permease subunit
MAHISSAAQPRRVPAPTAVPGTTWFGAMVALWTIFLTLLVVSPETLDDTYDWLRGLPLLAEILMWIVLLPWALAHLVWESSWEQWVRVVVLVLLVTVHLAVSAPREQSCKSAGDGRA